MAKRDAERARSWSRSWSMRRLHQLARWNPAALKKFLDTGGASFARGLENFAADLGNGGLPAQVDARAFAVGRTSPRHPERWCTAAR